LVHSPIKQPGFTEGACAQLSDGADNLFLSADMSQRREEQLINKTRFLVLRSKMLLGKHLDQLEKFLHVNAYQMPEQLQKAIQQGVRGISYYSRVLQGVEQELESQKGQIQQFETLRQKLHGYFQKIEFSEIKIDLFYRKHGLTYKHSNLSQGTTHNRSVSDKSYASFYQPEEHKPEQPRPKDNEEENLAMFLQNRKPQQNLGRNPLLEAKDVFEDAKRN